MEKQWDRLEIQNNDDGSLTVNLWPVGNDAYERRVSGTCESLEGVPEAVNNLIGNIKKPKKEAKKKKSLNTYMEAEE